MTPLPSVVAIPDCPVPVPVPAPAAAPAPAPAPVRDALLAPDTHALGESIAALATRIHAATYELLVMLVDFDERQGWNTGFLSCAHWLHWRTSVDLGAAREKVRVARALPSLPLVSAEMRRGRLSYAKVRALTRVATPDNEQALVDLALAGTCTQVERVARAWRRVDQTDPAREAEARHLGRQLSTWVDDDGMVVLRGRLTPEVGAVVQRALEAAADRLFRETAGASTGSAMAEDVTPAQRRADALGLLAESAMATDLDGGNAGDRYQVVLHVTAAQPVADPVGPMTPTAAPAVTDSAIEVDHGALYVSMETSRRLSCDASLVRMDHDASGVVLDVGRKTRTIPPSIRRALAARDTGCQFPGCTSRRCDAHHIDHWADGGATSLGNLVLLCRRHHRAVHEGGFAVHRTSDGQLAFVAPGGIAIPTVPPAQIPTETLPPLPGVGNDLPVWDGTPFDLTWAIDVLYRPVSSPRNQQEDDYGCGSCGNRSLVSKELVGALPA